MAIPKIELSAEALARARLDYESHTGSVGAIAAELGVSCELFYRIVRREGWAMRRPAVSRAMSRRPRKRAGKLRPMGMAGQAAELERLSARNMNALRRALAGGDDPDRLSRAIALQTRTLESLRKLQAGLQQDNPTNDPPPPRSLAELRDELRDHLVRIQEERGSRTLAREAECERRRGLAAALASPVPAGPDAAAD